MVRGTPVALVRVGCRRHELRASCVGSVLRRAEHEPYGELWCTWAHGGCWEVFDVHRRSGLWLHGVFPWGGTFIAFVIMISAFGTATIYTFGVPRIYFAMAKDGVFFKSLARLHPQFHTPVNAIVLQSVWAIILIRFWGQLEKIINYVVFTDWCFFLLAALSVVILRNKKPNKERPYRVWGYPVVPAIFILIVIWFIFNILFSSDDAHDQAFAGLFVLSAGIPFYLYFKKY